MSGSISSAKTLALKNSPMAGALMGSVSLVQPQGYQATTPIFIDDTPAVPQANGVFNPALNSIVKFNIDKTSTLVSSPIIEITLSAGQTNPAFDPNLAIGGGNIPQAEYVRNAGDLLGEQTDLIYGNSTLQTFQGRFCALWRTLCQNDVDIEGKNAQVLGNLSPGGASEAVLIDAFYRGVTLYIPLDELFFVHSLDQAWMPEAYALEGQIQTRLAAISQIVNTSTRDGTVLTGGGAIIPFVTSCQMRYQDITLSAAEKDNRLKLYRTPEGLVQHFLGIEFQNNLEWQGSAARGADAFPQPLVPTLSGRPLLRSPRLMLGNLRMDMAEMIIVVNRVAADPVATNFPLENGVIDLAYAGSFLESDTSASLLFTGAAGALAEQGFSTLVDIESFQLFSGQKALYESDIDGFWNRSQIRKFYHPKAQLRGAIYIISFARFPEDQRNATGHISAAVAGQLGLEIVTRDPGPTIRYRASVYVHVHNFMQSRGGGIASAY